MRPTAPRITPLPESEWTDEVRELLPKQGRVLNVFATLARHPKLFKRWQVFATHVLAKSSLPKQLMDLVFAIGQYTLVSMALNSFGVQTEDGSEGWPK